MAPPGDITNLFSHTNLIFVGIILLVATISLIREIIRDRKNSKSQS